MSGMNEKSKWEVWGGRIVKLVVVGLIFGLIYWLWASKSDLQEQIDNPKPSVTSTAVKASDAPKAPEVPKGAAPVATPVQPGGKDQAEDSGDKLLEANRKMAKLEARLEAMVARLEVEVAKAKSVKKPQMTSEHYGVTGAVSGSGISSASANAEALRRSQVLVAEAEARAKAIAEAEAMAEAAAREASRIADEVVAPQDEEVSASIEACAKSSGARWIDVLPYLEGGEVILSDFPEGATLVNVWLYDDVRGIKPLPIGPKTRFALLPGAGFNFQWRDREGHVHYQMITPQAGALLEGTDLDVDCSHKGGCKYVRPVVY